MSSADVRKPEEIGEVLVFHEREDATWQAKVDLSSCTSRADSLELSANSASFEHVISAMKSWLLSLTHLYDNFENIR